MSDMFKIKAHTKRLLTLYDKGERNPKVIAEKVGMSENAVYLALRIHRRFSRLEYNRELARNGSLYNG